MVEERLKKAGARGKNINQVVSQKLCNTCGACSAVCETRAIDFKETVGGYYFPDIDSEKCNYCGLCSKVCPGINFCDTLLEEIPADPFKGNALSSYIGKAKNKDIFQNSQSGGIASALLCHILETGLADAAVTVAMDWGKPSRPIVQLAKSVKEIINAQKSKYCPVPILKVMREIEQDSQRVIFTGLPCQIHGLWNIFEFLPGLKDRIILTIGLICDRTMTNAAIDYMVSASGIGGNEDQILYFRDKQCGGYPGNVCVQSRDGQKVVMPSGARAQIKDFFTPARCRLCFDKMNIFSDITIGDPWGMSGADHKNGESVCIARNDRGLKFLQSAIDSKVAALKEINYNEVLDGQKIENKRTEWRGFTEAWRKLGLKPPNYYECVKAHTGYVGSRKYQRKLQFSLALDSFRSREELIRHVKVKLRGQKTAGRDEKLFIKIKGTGFTNKGAELMLRAVLQKVGGKIPQAKFVHAPGPGSPFEKRAGLGLYQEIQFFKFGIPWGAYLGKYIPRGLRESYGLVSHEEIKIVFDASGFGYGDQWGPGGSLLMANDCKKRKRHGTKIIILPQAFGPFTSPKIRMAVTKIVETADLIYARDKISYGYITELAGERPNVKMAPDVTILVDGIAPDYFMSENDKIGIIPNHRMINKASKEDSKRYLPFLIDCAKYLTEKGEDVFILIHEGKNDLSLAKEIIKRIKTEKPIEIISETDPLIIKGIIGKCKGVIGSRFHGLFSALSQGVPSLCAGWSHKYKALFEDYDFPEGVLSIKSTHEEIRRAVDLITEESSRNKISENLIDAAKKQKILVEAMWEEIFREILPIEAIAD